MTKSVIFKPGTNRAPWKSRPFLLLFAVFTSVFLYVWFRVEPALEYQLIGPYFFSSSSFAVPYFNRPGGPVEYLAILISQLNHYNWLGALVFASLCGLIFQASRLVLRRGWGFASSLPSVTLVLLLLICRNSYGSPALPAGIALLLAISAALVYLLLEFRSLACRAAICLVASAGLFYVAGFGASLLFLLLAALAREQGTAHPVRGAVCLFAGLLPLAVYILLVGVKPVAFLTPWDSKFEVIYGPDSPLRKSREAISLVLLAALHLLLPAAASIAALAYKVSSPHPVEKPRHQSKPSAQAHTVPAHRSGLVFQVLSILTLVAGIAALAFYFDDQVKNRARVDYLSSRNDYDRLLAFVPSLTSIDFGTQARLHRALYHSGRFASDLFAYPCMTELLPGVIGGLSACRAQSQALLELGLISEAEHLAHEALEFEGTRPDLLRLLAQVNVLKGRPKAAKVFLNVLSQMPLERASASVLLRELETSPSLQTDSEVARIRSCLLTNDYAHSGLPTEALLNRLMAANPHNKMAFEYLLASYLIHLDLNRACASIPLLDDLGYKAIPRHLEEALLLNEKLNGARTDLRGRKISPETLARFENFIAMLTRLPDQGLRSRRALGRQFGDTYWFFYVIKEADTSQSGNVPSAP